MVNMSTEGSSVRWWLMNNPAYRLEEVFTMLLLHAQGVWHLEEYQPTSRQNIWSPDTGTMYSLPTSFEFTYMCKECYEKCAYRICLVSHFKIFYVLRKKWQILTCIQNTSATTGFRQCWAAFIWGKAALGWQLELVPNHACGFSSQS